MELDGLSCTEHSEESLWTGLSQYKKGTADCPRVLYLSPCSVVPRSLFILTALGTSLKQNGAGAVTLRLSR